jgi:Domain of unknown function (DUF397)
LLFDNNWLLVLSIIGLPAGRFFLIKYLEDAVAGGRLDTAAWQRSSFCDNGACVEVRIMGRLIAVRESGNADGAILTFPASSWQIFTADVKAGKFEAVR